MADNDRLGLLGENAFADLCERAGLYASKLTPDRTGKDFIVEWPMKDTAGLDSRPPPLRCNVQVKATRIGSRQVKVKLSAAEWLVKDERPSFFIVPVFGPDDRVDHYYAFHLDGDILERMLIALRKATAEDADPRKKSVSLTLSRGIRLREAGVAGYMLICAGPNPEPYATRKRELLRTLGYADDGAEYKVTFFAKDVSEIVSCIMGERSLTAEIGPARRVRFGIMALESSDLELPAKGHISFGPMENQSWTFTTGTGAASSLELNAVSAVVAGLPAEHWREKATNGLVEYVMHGGKVSLSFQGDTLSKRSYSLNELADSFKFWRTLLDSEGRFTVTRKNGRSLEMRVDVRSGEAERNWMDNALKLIAASRRLFDFCRVTPGEIIYDDVAAQKRDIFDAVAKISLQQVAEPWIMLRADDNLSEGLVPDDSKGETLLMTLPVVIGEQVLALAIGYTVIQERSDDERRLIAVNRFPISGSGLDRNNAIKEYGDFVDRMRREVAPRIHAHHELADTDQDSESGQQAPETETPSNPNQRP